MQRRLKEGYKGVNSLDKACKQHDINYLKNKNTKERNVADDLLARQASEIALDEKEPDYVRKDARLVTGVMGMKSRFGMGLSKNVKNELTKVSSEKLKELYYNPKTGYSGIDDLVRKSGLSSKIVKDWLSHQNVYTLHKPIRHKFPTRRVLVSAIDDQWQADLVDMQKYKTQNKNINYILTVMDIFSKYAWGVPIKKKTGYEIAEAFQYIFKERIPRKIHTDKGLEFINTPTQKLFEKNEIHWFATENETKAQVVERFNRTLKSIMWKYFTENKTKI